MKSLRILVLALAALLCSLPASGQLAVKLQIKRRLFIIHEPVMATVSVTNLAGRDITLNDTPEGVQWFSFQIFNSEQRSIPPRDVEYSVPPVAIEAGQTVTRTVNLNELYQLGEFGAFRVRAHIYFDDANKYFSSTHEYLEFTEGHKIWNETVGVPEGREGTGGLRTFRLMTHDQGKGKILYARVESKEDGMVYGTYPLGRILDGHPPDAKFDAANNLYVLQLAGQKTYFLSRIGVNGEFLGQSTYVTPKSRPYLRPGAGGTMELVGARKQQLPAAPGSGPLPKLSDRPPGMKP